MIGVGGERLDLASMADGEGIRAAYLELNHDDSLSRRGYG